MSKWFASAQDISESESSSSSDEEKKTVPVPPPVVAAPTTAAGAKKASMVTASNQARSKFMKNFGDSSESEEEQRVVKTGQDKKREALNLLFSDLKNHLKINDFGMIMTDFERLTEEIQRALDGIGNTVEMEPGDKLPNAVLRAFIKIEDAINETNQAVKDKKITLSK
jgi:hypothetical protein